MRIPEATTPAAEDGLQHGDLRKKPLEKVYVCVLPEKRWRCTTAAVANEIARWARFRHCDEDLFSGAAGETHDSV
jgi:hypothetical protein